MIWSVTVTDSVEEKKGKAASTPSKGKDKAVLGQAVVDLLPLLQGRASSSSNYDLSPCIFLKMLNIFSFSL